MKTTPDRMFKNRIRGFCLFAGLALALPLMANYASAQTGNPTPSLLAAKWWQWVLEAPISSNPLWDETGDFAAVNQPNGNIWFLAGYVNKSEIHRDVTIPAGKSLFFPVVNYFDVEAGNALPGGTKVLFVKQPLQEAQNNVSQVMATASDLSCSLDGTEIPITKANLEQSVPFTFMLPADNILGAPAGIYYPAVDSGYYVLLKPLPPGQHTIGFSASLGGAPYVDVIYHITIQ